MVGFHRRRRDDTSDSNPAPVIDTMSEDNGDEDDDELSDSQFEDNKTKIKNRRPKENAFTQQKLKAYHPILTPKTVIPLLILIAIIFIPIGAGMLYGSNQIQEMIIDYSYCTDYANKDYYTEIPSEFYDFNFKDEINIKPQWKIGINETWSKLYSDEENICHLQFQIPNDIGPHIYLFYRLKDFYANHRRYVKSFSEDQLNGKAASTSDIKDTTGQNCQPLSINSQGKKYYPCGLIANSLFNDTFSILQSINSTTSTTNDDYQMTTNGIAWSTNKNRFKKTKYNIDEIVPPPNWIKQFPNGYNETNLPDISTWFEFQNWMQPAALPLFSKMISRNDNDVLSKGLYQIDAGLHWPVDKFNGRKSIYLTTRSVIGGKNSFLGISWIVGGGICLILSIIFLIVNMLHPRKTGDLTLLSWNKSSAL